MYAACVDKRWPIAVTKARESRGISQRDMGGRMGVSNVAYGNRERGATEITDEWLARFLATINMTRVEFDEIVRRVPVAATMLPPTIPLYPSLAAAGRRAFVPDDTQEYPTDFIPRATSSQHPQAFACRVDGDSMMPDIRPGEIVICEPVDDEFGEIEDGKVVVVWGDCEETRDVQISEAPRRAKQMIVPSGGMIGQWVWTGGGAAELRKFNPKYPAIKIPAQHDGKLCIGVVVETRRKW